LYKPVWVFFIFAFPTVHIQWNGVDPGDITRNSSSFPIFSLSDAIAPGEVLHFEIEMEYCNISGHLFKETFQFSYTVPIISDGGNGGGDGDNGEDNMVIILLIISASSIGGIVAIVAIIIIKKRKSNFLRTDIN
jgi:hypothetical protein